MPIAVLCPKCGKKLSAPDAAAGKRAKCPHCGQVMQLPELPKPVPPKASEELPGLSEELPDLNEKLPDLGDPNDVYGVQGPLGGVSAEQFDEMLADTGPRVDVPSADPNRFPCPACGEMIVRGTAKCRYCNEILDPTLKQKQKQKRKKKRSSGGDDELTALDWILAIFCGTIACILGVIWLIQGNPKGPKMLGAVLLAMVGWFVAGFIFGALGIVQ
ncbi:MAG: hypothetical protein JW888_06335 [Pirellulales bacterium]|nr:hypothetical protein [Pirellulales bacterium]